MSEIKTHKNLAHRYTRLASYLIDQLLLGIPFYLLIIVLLVIAGVSVPLKIEFTSLWIYLLALILVTLILGIAGFVYYFYLISKYGQTVGMKYVGIKIVKEDGSYLTKSEAAIRQIAFSGMLYVVIMLGAIPFIGPLLSLIGQAIIYGWCLFDKNKQNLYDKLYNNYYEAEGEKTSRAKWIIGITAIVYFIAFTAIISYLIFTVMSDASSNLSKRNQAEELLKNKIEQNKKTEAQLPEIKMPEIEKVSKEEVNEAPLDPEKLTVNKNLYNSNLTNCMKDPDAYVAMKFPGKKALDGAKFCDCRATVVAIYYTYSVAKENEMLIKSCSIYTK